MTVTSIRDGATADSKTPRSTLVVTRPAQLFAADVQTTMMPHCVRVSVNHIYTTNMDVKHLWGEGTVVTYKNNHHSKIFCRWKHLHAVYVWKLTGQVRDVKDHGQLTELIACSVEIGSQLDISIITKGGGMWRHAIDISIFSQAHDIGIVDERLV